MLLGIVVRLGWGPLRHLPASMRPHLQGLPGWLRGGDLISGALLVVVTVLVTATTVLPASAARWAGALLGTVAVVLDATFHLAGIVGIVGAVGHVGRRA